MTLLDKVKAVGGDAIERMRIAKEAFAIKPDTSALKALIGEPVATIGYDEIAGNYIMPDYNVELPHGTKLYAVKGYL